MVHKANVSGFAAAVHTGKDMAACNLHTCVTLNNTRHAVPFRMAIFDVGIITRTATKNVAKESLAVGRIDSLAHIHRIIRMVRAFKGPVRTLGQLVIVVHRCGKRVKELIFSVPDLFHTGWGLTRTNLSALDFDIGVTQHMAVFSATIHRAFHPCRAADGHLSVADCSHEVNEAFVIVFRIDQRIVIGVSNNAFTSTKYVTEVCVF